MLDWAITHQSDPFLVSILHRSPVDPSSSGSTRQGSVVDVRPELLLILKMLILLMEKLPLSKLFPAPKLDLPPTLEPGLSQSFKRGGFGMPSSRFGSVSEPPETTR